MAPSLKWQCGSDSKYLNVIVPVFPRHEYDKFNYEGFASEDMGVFIALGVVLIIVFIGFWILLRTQ